MSQILSLNDVRGFLQRYKEFSDAHFKLRQKEFQLAFNHIKNGIDSIKKVCKGYEKDYGTNFNIFKILGVGHKEVKTHSALLSNLLDPHGAHGQGNVFLKTFFTHLKKNLKSQVLAQLNDKVLAGGEWEVEKEKVTFYGNLDIVLVEKTTRFLMVIENKIYAGDQANQLKRYSQWIKNSPYKNNAVLVYLTLWGGWSSEKEPSKTDYFCLSYKEDIKNWISFALTFIEAPRLRDILRQYLNLIDTL